MLGLLKDRYLRIDPRSLGLFRIGLSLALLADLFHRWDWLDAFYSNNGVLPNHNHLFVLREKEPIWSLLHAFSSEGENFAAFVIFLCIYLALLVGWHTRVFQVLALIAFVSLTGRNVLLESPGNSLAIMLLLMSLFLPLGQRFSIDNLRASFNARDEHTPEQLNRREPEANTTTASLTALGLTLVLGCILLFAAMLQSGPAWQDGDALYYALHLDRYSSTLGVWARNTLSIGVLNGWTKLFHLAEFALLPLLLVPVARHYLRTAAAVLLGVVGATIALFFNYGVLGWALLACVALVIPAETWARIKQATRPIKVLYDDDCGICLWSARLLKRLDARHNITFVGNSVVTTANPEDTDDSAEDPGGHDALPAAVTAAMVERSIVVIDEAGNVHTDHRAFSEMLRALPFPWPLFGWLLRIPGLSQLADLAYRAVASRRIAISVALGMGACGIPMLAEQDEQEAAAERPSPARRALALSRCVVVNAISVVMLLSFLAQSEARHPLPLSTGLGQAKRLTHLASLPRMMGAWDLWAPEPPRENAALVTEAQTRDGWEVDVLTGYPPDLDLKEPRRSQKGVLWAAYSEQIQKEDYDAFRKELRRYLTRGGYAVDTSLPGNYIASLTAYWVHQAIPPPGSDAPPAEIVRDEILSHRKRPTRKLRPSTPTKMPPVFRPKPR